MDATRVKAEIKTWEHDFRAQNGRNATVEDIKAHPHIAAKYKLYKKLCKDLARAEPQASGADPPRTPRAKPKLADHAHPTTPGAILTKSIPTASAVDITTQNPFSPAKRKQMAAAPSESGTLNPFLTPVKAKRSPSPDLFPPILDSTASIPVPAPAPQQNPAVVKARKRLRGEPVSPSPNPRDKRRRLDILNDPSPSRSVSPTPALAEEGDNFVADSPVKAPAGGKAFTPLFEEAKMPLSQPVQLNSNTVTQARVFSRAKTLPGGLFGGAKKEGAQGGTANGSEMGKKKEPSVNGASKGKKKRALPGPIGLIPGKDDLFEEPPSASSSSSAQGRNATASRKRTLSKSAEDEPKDKQLMSTGWNLLPPSPPPQKDAGWHNGKGKGKAKAKARDPGQRKSKKVKLVPAASDEDVAEDLAEDSSSSESADVKMVAWRGRRQSSGHDGDDLASALDPELQFHLRSRAGDVRAQSASPCLEKFEVDLPEEMQRVLALSARDWDREKEEEDLVNGLIKGRRKGGGEIWGPGEVGGEQEESEGWTLKTRGEDDWEGEGVRWEIAEL